MYRKNRMTERPIIATQHRFSRSAEQTLDFPAIGYCFAAAIIAPIPRMGTKATDMNIKKNAAKTQVCPSHMGETNHSG